jgi:CHRD domain
MPLRLVSIAFLSILLLQACEHDTIPGPGSVKKWEEIPLHASFEVPAVPGRNEEGDVSLELLSDNSLVYNFHIHNLKPGDVLTAAHIHAGDPGTSGDVLIELNPSFVGSGAQGIVKDLRPGQVDSLLNTPVYINIHSAQVNSGLVRGQLDKEIELAMDIALSGANEVPVVPTAATGQAILRLTSDKVLYSKVTVSNLEANDTLTVSHIHRGGAGANGGVRIFLCAAEADFGVLKVSAPLHDTLYQMLTTNPMYVNVHSRRFGPGLIRGQVR